MEACMKKPEVKKKPKLPKPPSKPAEIQSNEPEPLKKPPPVVPPRPTDSELSQTQYQLTTATTNNEEKEAFLSGTFKKSNKPEYDTPAQENLSAPSELSTTSDSLPENNKEKKRIFSGKIFRKPQKSTEAAQTDEDRSCLNGERSGSNDDLSDNSKENGFFSGLLRKSNKIPGAGTPEQAAESVQSQLSDTSDSLSESKEKGGIFTGIFKKSPKPLEDANVEEDNGGGSFSEFLKKTLKVSGQRTESLDMKTEKEPSASNEDLSESNTTKVKRNGLAGIFRRSASCDNLFDEESPTEEDKKFSASLENLLEATISKEKTGRLAGIFKKSPKPAPRSIATEDPLSSTKERSASWDSLEDAAEENLSEGGEFSASNNNLSDAKTTTKEKKVGFAGMFRRTPKTVEQQENEDQGDLEGDKPRRKRTVKQVVSFRIKRTFPKIPDVTVSSQTSDKVPLIEEDMELRQLNQQEKTVEVQPVEMAPYPTENNPLESEQESDELMEWWNTVKGWTEWNETSNFQEEEIVMEQAADRVYLAARLFVHLFNQHGASLQCRILELLALADTADQFHKKTVGVAVGGGVASVVGSVATITGLILAPFTFGASVIVTAVGISVATAGSITSATANITDTVHSSMDRKKVEKMIQGYQEEITDIRECLEFVQEGMVTLQEWDFEQYSQSAAKKALNHSVKHVLKEGGRAGKELIINTDKLVTTVHVLGVAGGAAKAAQVISVTTGVMSALFLALDVFFLAKDSHELRKGAKTKFAAKIREVCKDLQDGLLELNKVKTQLQKTMDGIEVEEYEEIQEVEVEVEDDPGWDLKKLAELEQELDLLEEKLDKKVAEEQKNSKEEKENVKIKEKKEKNTKEKGDPEKKDKKDESSAKKEGKKEKGESTLEKLPDETERSVKAATEVVKEQPQKGSKKDKETENQITAGREKYEGKRDKAKEDSGTNAKTDGKEKKVDVKEQAEAKSRSCDSEREDMVKVKTESESQRSMRSREDVRRIKPEWRSVSAEKEVEIHGTRRLSSRSDREDGEGGSRHEMRETDKEKGSSSRDMERLSRKEIKWTESWRGTEEDRAVKDWRAERANRREEKREVIEGTKCRRESDRGSKREDHRKPDGRKESRRSAEAASRKREWRSSTEESDSKRSHCGRATALRDERRERGDEKHGRRVEKVGRQTERTGGDEEEVGQKRGRRREDGDSWRKEREHEHSRRGNRPRANAVLGDGLYI